MSDRGMVQTVTGPLAPDALGFTLPHEHILCDAMLTHRGPKPSPSGAMGLTDRDRAAAELRKYRAAGGRAVVEVTTAGWGRDMADLKALSEATGVAIVATAGYYTWPFIPWEVEDHTVEDMAAMLIRELTDGADGTDIRAGILKSAIHFDRIERVEAKCLAAVARACLATGAAITTHTSGKRKQEIPGGNVGRQHLKALLAEGIPAHRLVNGHIDEQADIAVLSELAEAGAYVQFDTVEKQHYMLDRTRARLIKALIDRGHLKRILIATDRARKSELYEELGGVGYTYVIETFLGMLREEGVSNAEIERICCVNPGEMLAF